MKWQHASASSLNQVSLIIRATNCFIFGDIEILELDMCKDDKLIVIASDGVWEFLSNEDVAGIVWPFFEKRNAEGAAEALVRESYLKWKHEEDDIIDDITCVIIFLDVKLP
jgi:serine/threonine protein phosphatase PrpC